MNCRKNARGASKYLGELGLHSLRAMHTQQHDGRGGFALLWLLPRQSRKRPSKQITTLPLHTGLTCTNCNTRELAVFALQATAFCKVHCTRNLIYRGSLRAGSSHQHSFKLLIPTMLKHTMLLYCVGVAWLVSAAAAEQRQGEELF